MTSSQWLVREQTKEEGGKSTRNGQCPLGGTGGKGREEKVRLEKWSELNRASKAKFRSAK